MKIILMCLFILTGCATKADKKPVMESKKLKPITYEQKKVSIQKMLDEHKDFKEGEREKVEKLVFSAIARSEALRVRESQLLQQLARYTLVKKGTYTQIKKLKDALKKVYSKKYENVSKTINELKDVVGIKPVNQRLMQGFHQEHILEFR